MCYIVLQDWCIDHGYTELSPYAGVSGRAEVEARAAAGQEGLEGSGAEEQGEEYQYDDDYQEY